MAKADPAAGRPEKSKAKTAPIASGTTAHHDAAFATKLAREAHARSRYELIWTILMGLIAALVVCLLLIGYLALRPVEVRVVAMTPDGTTRALETLSEPLQNESTVIAWASQAVTQAFTLSFSNSSQEIDDLRGYFTTSGYQSYRDGLTRSQFVDNIIRTQTIATAAPTAAPTVTAQGLVGSEYGWRLHIPMVVTYSANSSTSQRMLVEVTVVRRPASESSSGLGIAQIATTNQ